MSVKMMFAAMNVETGSPITKLVLIKLADNANEQGECWPSHETIARICEMSVKSSQRHIKKLCELGLVEVKKRKGPQGNSSNFYQLNLESVETISRQPTEEIETISRLDSDRKSPTIATESRPNLSVEPIKEPVRLKTAKPEQAIVDLYNKILANKSNDHSLPSVKVLTDKRKRVINKFWNLVEKDLDRVESYFTWLLQNAGKHKWLFGVNERNWIADIEFVCRDETLAKATENRLADWRDAA